MGGPVGGALSQISKKTKIGGANGVSPLDPLQLGPKMFDKADIPDPAAPPPPVDAADPYFKALARQATERQLRQGKGRTNAFLTLDPAPVGYASPGVKSKLGQ